MRIAITGANGMIGKKLVAFFLAQGHQVAVVIRSPSYQERQAQIIRWDPTLSYIEFEKLEGYDVIIHLAGASVSEYWSTEYKKVILESRVQSTKLLGDALARLVSKPKLLISASAIGYYGNHSPQEILDEKSSLGDGFLAAVCKQWEEQARIAESLGIRVVRARLGVVLSPTGGALAKMRLPFQLGVGGVLGSGQQMMSWIALDEIPFVFEYFINNVQITGAVNVVSPQAISNAEFTKSLGEAIHRPTILPVPSFVIRLLFGEMGQNLLLEGAHVQPKRLQEAGYQFRFPELKDALKKAFQ